MSFRFGALTLALVFIFFSSCSLDKSDGNKKEDDILTSDKAMPSFDVIQGHGDGDCTYSIDSDVYWSHVDIFDYGLISEVEFVTSPFKTEYTDLDSSNFDIDDCVEFVPILLLNVQSLSSDIVFKVLIDFRFFRNSNSKPILDLNSRSVSWTDENYVIEEGQIVGGGFQLYSESNNIYVPYVDIFQVSGENISWSSSSSSCNVLPDSIRELDLNSIQDILINEGVSGRNGDLALDRYPAFCRTGLDRIGR